MKKYVWGIGYSLLLTAFTVYLMLDTFVIERVYTEVPYTGSSADEPTESTDASEASENSESNTDEEVSRENEDTSGTDNTENSDSFWNNNEFWNSENFWNTPGFGNNEGFGNTPGGGYDGGFGRGNSNNGFDTFTPNGNSKDNRKDSAKPEEASPVQTENSYSDENITITLTEYRENDTTIYVADVQLSSAEYLKTAFAKDSYGKNVTQKTSTMASDNNAILAINGDYYGSREKGYVLRNGVLYRSISNKNQEDLVIYKDGSFDIITEGEISAYTLADNGAQQILSFGPSLVIDGEISVSEKDEVGKSMASNPRTAIGIIDELHYVFVVSDGRTQDSNGLSLLELAEFMVSLNVNTAYNLDGGGSSTMVFQGEVINTPTTNGRTVSERSVSDIVYIGY